MQISGQKQKKEASGQAHRESGLFQVFMPVMLFWMPITFFGHGIFDFPFIISIPLAFLLTMWGF